MTATAIILACFAVILVVGVQRRQAGRALTDITVLVVVFGLITIADVVISRFVDTGNTGWTLAAILAAGFALDAVYGLMAPQRQRQRDRRLREFMRRRRA